MPPQFVTPDLISKHSLMLLRNEGLTGRLMQNPDIEVEFKGGEKKGDYVDFRRRSVVRPKRHTGSGATTTTLSEAKERLEIVDHLYTKVGLTAAEQTLHLEDFVVQVVQPVVSGFVEELNEIAIATLKKVYWRAGTAGASANTPEAFRSHHEKLNANHAPRKNRIQILDGASTTRAFGIEAFHKANERGDGGRTISEGDLARVAGFNFYEETADMSHTNGTLASPVVNGAVAAGATTMAVDGGVGTETITEGTLFTVDGVAGYEGVFTGDFTATGGAIAGVTFSPKAPAGGFADDAAITLVPSHTKNVAYSHGAFALVTIPTAPSKSVPSGMFFDGNMGFSVKFAYDTDGLGDVAIFECLVGSELLEPDAALIHLG